MRLDKFLSGAGVGTRSEVKKLLKSGAVSLEGGDGRLRPEQQIDPETDRVFVNGKEIRYRAFVYLMLNKPAGYISAVWDKKLPTVLDLVPEEYLHYSPAPVGRLDIDTEGLLILTNDGAMSHRLLSPKNHIPKTYLARLEHAPDPSDIERFQAGIVLDDGYRCRPAHLAVCRREEQGYWAEVTVTEGKFHQVKRMFQAINNRVCYLKRIRMNGLDLDEGLPLGTARELTEKELDLLQNGK